jgi:hypothetical protein
MNNKITEELYLKLESIQTKYNALEEKFNELVKSIQEDEMKYDIIDMEHCFKSARAGDPFYKGEPLYHNFDDYINQFKPKNGNSNNRI